MVIGFCERLVDWFFAFLFLLVFVWLGEGCVVVSVYYDNNFSRQRIMFYCLSF